MESRLLVKFTTLNLISYIKEHPHIYILIYKSHYSLIKLFILNPILLIFYIHIFQKFLLLMIDNINTNIHLCI